VTKTVAKCGEWVRHWKCSGSCCQGPLSPAMVGGDGVHQDGR